MQVGDVNYTYQTGINQGLEKRTTSDGSLFFEGNSKTYVVVVDVLDLPRDPKSFWSSKRVSDYLSAGHTVSIKIEWKVTHLKPLAQAGTLSEIRVETLTANLVYNLVFTLPRNDGGFNVFFDADGAKIFPFQGNGQSLEIDCPTTTEACRKHAEDVLGMSLTRTSGEDSVALSYSWGACCILMLRDELDAPVDDCLLLLAEGAGKFNAIAMITLNKDGVLPRSLTDRAIIVSLPANLFEISVFRESMNTKMDVFLEAAKGLEDKTEHTLLAFQLMRYLNGRNLSVINVFKDVGTTLLVAGVASYAFDFAAKLVVPGWK